MKMLDVALRYLRLGFAVLPAQGKRPIVNWKTYQERRPTVEDVASWWTRYPSANIALVTGRVSGVVVVDVDGEAPLRLAPTATVKSSPGHYHYYYAHPGVPVPCCAGGVAPGVDVRGDGGVVILPPSLHFDRYGRPDGRYSWIVGPRQADGGAYGPNNGAQATVAARGVPTPPTGGFSQEGG